MCEQNTPLSDSATKKLVDMTCEKLSRGAGVMDRFYRIIGYDVARMRTLVRRRNSGELGWVYDIDKMKSWPLWPPVQPFEDYNL